MAWQDVPDFLAGLPRWVLWREVTRNGKATKVPFVAEGDRPADSRNPADWATRERVRAQLTTRPAMWSGEGIVLGGTGADEVLAGMDLDKCLEDGAIVEWAKPYVRIVRTYAEVSPSGTGLKFFFRLKAADLAAVRHALELPDDQDGRKVTYGTGQHPPAAELYLGGRYFTVTGAHWHECPEEVAVLSAHAMQALAAVMGPRKVQRTGSAAPMDLTAPDPGGLAAKLKTAMAQRPKLDARYHGSLTGLADQSGSGFDMSLGAMLKAAGFTYAEMRAALVGVPHARGAAADHDAAGDDRYFERIWGRSAAETPEQRAANVVREEGPMPPEPPPEAYDGFRHGPAPDERHEGGGNQEEQAQDEQPAKPILWQMPGEWDERDIPMRPWVAPGHLLRGAVTVVSGPGGGGKSSLMVAWSTCLTVGCAFGRFRASGPVRVLNYNVEDDEDEQMRRYSAMLGRLGLSPKALEGRLGVIGPTGVGTLLAVHPDGRALVNTHVMKRLKEVIVAFEPDVLMLDPFVELHGADENDNTAVRGVMAMLRTLAKAHDMAVGVLHHSRKGAGTPGDPDSIRGAGAIVGASRLSFTINPMSEDDAAKLGLKPEQRRWYFRLDDAKANYSPLLDAQWFEKQGRELANGDSVAVAWPWQPPNLAPSEDDKTRALKLIARGSPSGPWSPRFADDARSIRLGLESLGIEEQARQKALLDALLKDRAVVTDEFGRPGKSDTRQGLRTAQGEPRNWDWKGAKG